MSPTPLDVTFQAKRVDINRKVEDVAEKLWLNRKWTDRKSFTDSAIPVVEGGMGAIVSLVDAYMTQKVRMSMGDPHLSYDPLIPGDVDIKSVRGVSAEEVYLRPFGALGYQLALGADFVTADKYAADYVRKLAQMDMQLAFTTASAMWIGLYG